MVRTFNPVLAVGQRTQSTHGFTLIDMSSRPYEPFDLSDAASVELTMEHQYWGETTVESEPVTIPEETAAEGYVEYQFSNEETRYYGTHYVQFAIEWSDGSSDLVPPEGSDWELHVGRRLPRSSPFRSREAIIDEASIGSAEIKSLSVSDRMAGLSVGDLDATAITGDVMDGNRFTGFGGGFTWDGDRVQVAIDDFGTIEGLTLPMTQHLPLANYDIEGPGRAGTPNDPLDEVHSKTIDTEEVHTQELQARGGRAGTADEPLESTHVGEATAMDGIRLGYDTTIGRPMAVPGPFDIELADETVEVGERDWALYARASSNSTESETPVIVLRDGGTIGFYDRRGNNTATIANNGVSASDGSIDSLESESVDADEVTAESTETETLDGGFIGPDAPDTGLHVDISDPESVPGQVVTVGEGDLPDGDVIAAVEYAEANDIPVVFVPEGNYDTGGIVRVPSYTTLRGAGRGRTLLTHDSDAIISRVDEDTVGASVENLSLEATGSASAAISASRRMTIKKVHITGSPNHGINVGGGRHGQHIHNVQIENCDGEDLTTSASDTRVRWSEFEGRVLFQSSAEDGICIGNEIGELTDNGDNLTPADLNIIHENV